MVSRQKKTRKPADENATYSQRLQNARKHTAKIRKLASLVDGGE